MPSVAVVLVAFYALNFPANCAPRTTTKKLQEKEVLEERLVYDQAQVHHPPTSEESNRGAHNFASHHSLVSIAVRGSTKEIRGDRTIRFADGSDRK